MQDRLHEAAAAGDLDTIIKLSQDPKFNVNQRHSVHKTRAIDFAAQAGQLAVLKYLIENLNADITTKDQDKRNLLEWAASGGNGNKNNLEVQLYIISKPPFNTL